MSLTICHTTLALASMKEAERLHSSPWWFLWAAILVFECGTQKISFLNQYRSRVEGIVEW